MIHLIISSAYFVLKLYRELHDLGLACPTLTPPHPHLVLCTPVLRNLFPVSKCTTLSSVPLVFADALPSVGTLHALLSSNSSCSWSYFLATLSVG